MAITDEPADSTASKTTAGFAKSCIALALLLFVSAGTLRYWQAWLYLLVFFACVLFITAYLWKKDPELLRRRLNAGPKGEKDPVQKRIQFLASLAFMGVFILSALDHRFGWSAAGREIALAGDGLTLVGFVIVFMAFRANSFAGSTIEIAANQRLISTGPYGVVRHPMYSGSLLIFFGAPLALGSWWGLLMVGAMTLLIRWRLVEEETFLTLHLPGYGDYCRKVRYRLAPLVW